MLKNKLHFILLVIMLSACGQQQVEESSNNSHLQQEGIIVGIKGHQILVVPNIEKEDISNKTTDELNEMAQKKDGAYYSLYPGMYEELEVGAHVIVYWNGNQEESDPPQRVAEKIDIVSK